MVKENCQKFEASIIKDISEDILHVCIYTVHILQLELADTTAGESKVQPPSQFKNGRNLPTQAKGDIFCCLG